MPSSTKRKRPEEEVRRSKRLPRHKKSKQKWATYAPPYGDLRKFNTSRLLLDIVGPELLEDMAQDYLDLLQTSTTIYEKNGDYALGLFSSGWCRVLDQASYGLTGAADPQEARASGKWLCHESCWTEASKVSISTGQPVDIECRGGIRIYAVPIWAGDEVVGSLNLGYGDPPQDRAKLREIAARYSLRSDKLLIAARAYEARPSFLIALAKDRLLTMAAMIGEIVKHNREANGPDAFKKKDLFQVLVSQATDALIVVDREGMVKFVNPAAELLFERPLAQMLGQPFGFPVSGSDPVELEIVTSKQGLRIAEMRVAPINFNQEPLYAAYLRDVTEKARLREELRSLSFVDELTGLYNRRGFLTLAHQESKLAHRTKRGFMVIFVDIDSMKQINDELGHQAGDEALLGAAKVIGTTFRDSDIQARIGGDEFAVLALETKEWDESAIISRLETQVAAFNSQTNRPFTLSLSVGIAPYDPQCPSKIEELLSEADTLMYRNKRSKGHLNVIRK